MLYRAAVADVKNGRVSKRFGQLVVVMQFYPRFLTKKLIDEYVHALAPSRELFTEFKALDRELKDHGRAFGQVRYEARFGLTEEGKGELGRLSALARDRDVFLICQCESLQHCHGDLLLLSARHWFGAVAQWPRVKYPVFVARLEKDDPSLILK